ncbi:MAG: hypothetical protein WCC27_14055 [Acidobacteriaceae bacterium]
MACTFSGTIGSMGRDGVRLWVDVFGKHVIFFDQPIDLEPVVEAVFVAGVMRARVRSFLNVGDVF